LLDCSAGFVSGPGINMKHEMWPMGRWNKAHM
jgi:hypothetical protein